MIEFETVLFNVSVILLSLVSMGLVLAVCYVTHYKRTLKTARLIIYDEFQNIQNEESIESIRNMEFLKSKIEILADIKQELEDKIESLNTQSKMEIAQIYNDSKDEIAEIHIQSSVKIDEIREELELKAAQANKKSLALGQNIIKGELIQILSSFYLLTEYDSIALVSSVSRHASFDLIGVKKDSLDFIEVKAGSGQLSKNESIIKSLIENNKVRYRVIEGRLPKLDLKIRV